VYRCSVVNIYSDRDAGFGGLMGVAEQKDGNMPKKVQKTAPEKWARGPPGRGVLRFSRQAYRNPVHFSAKIAVFSKNLQI